MLSSRWCICRPFLELFQGVWAIVHCRVTAVWWQVTDSATELSLSLSLSPSLVSGWIRYWLKQRTTWAINHCRHRFWDASVYHQLSQFQGFWNYFFGVSCSFKVYMFSSLYCWDQWQPHHQVLCLQRERERERERALILMRLAINQSSFYLT